MTCCGPRPPSLELGKPCHSRTCCIRHTISHRAWSPKEQHIRAMLELCPIVRFGKADSTVYSYTYYSPWTIVNDISKMWFDYVTKYCIILVLNVPFIMCMVMPIRQHGLCQKSLVASRTGHYETQWASWLFVSLINVYVTIRLEVGVWSELWKARLRVYQTLHVTWQF